MVRQQGFIAGVMCGVILCASISHALETESLFSDNTAALFIKHASQVQKTLWIL
jgi:NhaP-type Na+/H+ or K+/H+ antiporter